MVLLQRCKGTIKIFTQQLVEKLLLRVAEPQQKRLMNLFEHGEVSFVLIPLVGMDRFGFGTGAGTAQIADECVVENAEQPGTKRRLAL